MDRTHYDSVFSLPGSSEARRPDPSEEPLFRFKLRPMLEVLSRVIVSLRSKTTPEEKPVSQGTRK